MPLQCQEQKREINASNSSKHLGAFSVDIEQKVRVGWDDPALSKDSALTCGAAKDKGLHVQSMPGQASTGNLCPV